MNTGIDNELSGSNTILTEDNNCKLSKNIKKLNSNIINKIWELNSDMKKREYTFTERNKHKTFVGYRKYDYQFWNWNE